METIIGALVGAAINLVLKGVSAWLDKAKATREAKEAFLKFVAMLQREGLVSVKLNESDQAQLNELEKRRKELEG